MQSYRYHLLAVCSAVLMATIGPIARLSGIDAANLTFYRLAFGAAAIGLMLLFSRRPEHLWLKPHWLVLLNGVLLACFILFFLRAIESIPLTLAIMLVYLAPALAAVIAHFLLQERLTLYSTAMILLAFIGFAFLQQFQLQLPEQQQQGFYFALLSLFTYSAFIVSNKKVPASQDNLNATFMQLLVGACCALPFAIGQGMPSAEQWPWLFAAGLLPGVLALYCAIEALSRLPASVYGTLAYVEPLTVMLCAVLLFAEPMSWMQMVGAGLIVIAGIAQSRPKQTAAAPQ